MIFKYEHAGANVEYPSYAEFVISKSGESIVLCVRGAARQVDSEDGAHYGPGHVKSTTLSIEQALDLAGEIMMHYGITMHYGKNALYRKVGALADFVVENFKDEFDFSENVLDVVERLLGDYAALLHAKQALDEGKAQAARALIAEGVRLGQVEKRGVNEVDMPEGVVDGSLPAKHSAPLGGHGFDVVGQQ